MRQDISTGGCVAIAGLILLMVVIGFGFTAALAWALHWVMLALVPTMPDVVAWIIAVAVALFLANAGRSVVTVKRD